MKSKVFAVITAILLIGGCGLYIAAEIMGIDISDYLKGWWTLFLIIPGVMGLFQKGARLPSVGLTLLGVALLAREQLWIPQLANVGFWQIFLAVFLFMAGVGILVGVFSGGKHFRVSVGGSCNDDDDDDDDDCRSHVVVGDENTAAFSSRHENYNGRVFEGKTFSTAFGEYVLDLRGAIIEHDCTIKADSAFGSITIYKTPEANFVCKGSQVFGSVNSHTEEINESLPTVTVIANAAFGAIELK